MTDVTKVEVLSFKKDDVIVVYGISSENRKEFKELLKERYGFDGLVISLPNDAQIKVLRPCDVE